MAATALRAASRPTVSSVPPVALLRWRVDALTSSTGQSSRTARHVIFDPVDLRIVIDRGDDDYDGIRIGYNHAGQDIYAPPEGEPWLHVSGLTEREIPISRASDCLWDSLKLLGHGRPFPTNGFVGEHLSDLPSVLNIRWNDWSSDDEFHFLETVAIPFIEKWGIAISRDEDYATVSSNGAHLDVSDWLEDAQHYHDILTTLAATEAGELVPEGLLWRLGSLLKWKPEWGSTIRDDYYKSRFTPGRPVSISQLDRDVNERILAHWRSLRAHGRGLEIQRAAVVEWLAESGLSWLIPSWDETGRRITVESYGWSNIAHSHLLELFGSAEPDVYLCSICGKPYPLPPGRRRPREGSKHFCSPDCRRESRLISQRASWHRNKDRWRGRNDE